MQHLLTDPVIQTEENRLRKTTRKNYWFSLFPETHIFQVKEELHRNTGKGKYLNLKKGMTRPSKNSFITMVTDGWLAK